MGRCRCAHALPRRTHGTVSRSTEHPRHSPRAGWRGDAGRLGLSPEWHAMTTSPAMQMTPGPYDRMPNDTMKAIAVIPGVPGSIHLRDVPMPAVADVPDGRGVLVRVLRVGVDGTDKEIN